MAITVEYEGITLVEGAEPRRAGNGLFVPMETPMPVGTRLRVIVDGTSRVGKVSRVHESADGAGVVIVGVGGTPFSLDGLPADEAAAPTPTPAGAPVADDDDEPVMVIEAAAPDEDPTLELPPVTAEEAEAAQAEAELAPTPSESNGQPDADGRRGRRRRKRR
jgi:hypothetical protein